MLVYGAGDEAECLSPRELVWRLLQGEGGDSTTHWLEMEMDVWKKCFVGKGLAFQLVCKILETEPYTYHA